MIVEYNTTLSYENVNKSTPYLFRLICVSAGFSHCSVAVTIVFAQKEIQTVCFETDTSVEVQSIKYCKNECHESFYRAIKIPSHFQTGVSLSCCFLSELDAMFVLCCCK